MLYMTRIGFATSGRRLASSISAHQKRKRQQELIDSNPEYNGEKEVTTLQNVNFDSETRNATIEFFW